MHCKNASPGIWKSRATARNENEVFLGMAGKWDARIYCPRFEWAEFSLVVFGRSKGNAVGWPRILEARRKLGFNGFKSAVFARVGFLPSSFSSRQESLLAPLHGLFYLALQVICPIWWTYPCSPTAFHAFPYFPCLFIIEIMMPMGAAPWHRKMRVPQWRVNGISIWKKSCIVMQQRHCNRTHSQFWFGTKLITLLLAKWFMRLRNISKIFNVSWNSVSTKRVTSKGQTHAIRGQKWKSYGPHSTTILFHVSWIRLIASTLIFVWVFRYSHLTCSKSLLRPWSSSSRKDRLLHGIQAIAVLVLPRLSRKYQGQSRVFERSGHVLKGCRIKKKIFKDQKKLYSPSEISFELFVARIRDQGMQHQQL